MSLYLFVKEETNIKMKTGTHFLQNFILAPVLLGAMLFYSCAQAPQEKKAVSLDVSKVYAMILEAERHATSDLDAALKLYDAAIVEGQKQLDAEPDAVNRDEMRRIIDEARIEYKGVLNKQQKQQEQARLQQQRAEQEKQERLQQQRAEQEKQARLRKQQEEQEEQARLRQQQEEQAEKERLQQQEAEQEEQAHLQQQRAEQEEQARLQQQRAEQEEQARLQKQQEEQEEQARLQQQREEQAKIARIKKPDQGNVIRLAPSTGLKKTGNLKVGGHVAYVVVTEGKTELAIGDLEICVPVGYQVKGAGLRFSDIKRFQETGDMIFLRFARLKVEPGTRIDVKIIRGESGPEKFIAPFYLYPR
jgi:hypothetical protein